MGKILSLMHYRSASVEGMVVYVMASKVVPVFGGPVGAVFCLTVPLSFQELV